MKALPVTGLVLTVSAGGTTASYNYDPFGRLDTVTTAGTVIERNVYDGFDHVVENRKNNGTSTSTTKYTYDPLDRTATKTIDAGGAKEKTTTFNYLGLSSEVLDEEVAGKITKSYQYSPWGQRLSQVTHKDDGTEENAYYGYDSHTDVETLTDDSGDTKATYGYTAYGKNDDAQFTGIDKPDAADPTKEPYNAYRFNAKRSDQNSQSYDMGFRDYSPDLNRFLTRDSYNGALSDLNLGLNPWTGNRYAFGAGNPITMVEVDGHHPCPGGGGGCYYDGTTTEHDGVAPAQPPVIDVETGLCTAECGPINNAIDAWYAEQGCDGSFGSIFHAACWSDRDEVERAIIGTAWQQQKRENVADVPLWPNQMKGTLQEELARADKLGVKPAQPGTPEFDAAVQSGTVKWAVLEDGTLVVVPKYVNGVEISHAVLSRGADVAAAGEAEIAGSSSSGYYGLDINFHSGHFQPSAASLQIGKNAFSMFGIEF